MKSDSHLDLYTTGNERKNWFKGCFFMFLLFAGAMGLVYLIVYLFGE